MAQAAGTTRAAPRNKSGCPGAIGGGLVWAGNTCSEVEGRGTRQGELFLLLPQEARSMLFAPPHNPGLLLLGFKGVTHNF